jgi:hypothetical protein
VIEAKADVEALIDRLIRHAADRKSLGGQSHRSPWTEKGVDWRSASSLWPGFARD